MISSDAENNNEISLDSPSPIENSDSKIVSSSPKFNVISKSIDDVNLFVIVNGTSRPSPGFNVTLIISLSTSNFLGIFEDPPPPPAAGAAAETSEVSSTVKTPNPVTLNFKVPPEKQYLLQRIQSMSQN